ncbi:ArsR/SmtB family transcription factor [Piscinibacter sp.]|uniref:ArsR/SmtB family transcription factor n=1 Tax=Piscinibacter sp. TaxID=1903157 RepID=UPI0039E4943F
MPREHEPRLARSAAMVADAARSRMLSRLLSGEAATAGELAAAASVTPATASGHLAQLLDAGFVICEPRGRHRYYRLASPTVAHALEALALVAEAGERDAAWQRPERARLREARCCYGHLAGRLGVRLFDALRERGGLLVAAEGFALSDAGRAWLGSGLGFAPAAPNGRRRYAYACMDWSQRRDHLAGQLADELLAHCLARGWLTRGEGRALALTPRGHAELLPALGPTAPT